MQFELGLTLTGTVSAGAYTGGVLDFLIEALEEWEKQKAISRELYKEDYAKWDVPWHQVIIKGLSGASGGGVTNGLFLNTIGRSFSPVRSPADTDNTNNDFYRVWVKLLGIKQLLETADLEGSKIKSLLNGNALPKVADEVLLTSHFRNRLSRPYIDDHLFAIITLTNLRGIPYSLDYQGSDVKSVTYFRHADYAKFELSPDVSSKYKDAYLIPYDISNGTFQKSFERLKDACLGTCAFPGAFKAQQFSQDSKMYIFRPFGAALGNLGGGIYDFLNSDGGILNTEPFELLHKAMLPNDIKENPRDPKDVVRSIIIVAPLEVDATLNPTTYNLKKDSLIDIAPQDINAIRQEALFSAEEVNLAFREDIYSRFMIAPSRSSKPGAGDMLKPAITGTILGDFGAFLSEDFRKHDYFLGRRNAQQFLRRHFAVPVDQVTDNPVFGPLDIRNRFASYLFNDGGIDYFPIIPLCGTAKVSAFFPVWPVDKLYDLGEIEDRFTNRLDKLSEVLVSSLKLNWIKRQIASSVIGNIKDAIVGKSMEVIKSELKQAGL